MTRPRLAVAIPTYQRPDYLAQLIDTIPTDTAVAVSDNAGSLAGLGLTWRAGVEVSPAPALIPIFANWNRALRLVDPQATHVVMPSDDDLYAPGGFDVIHRTIEQHPDVDVFIFGCGLVDEFGTTRAGYAPERLACFEPGHGLFEFERGVTARMPGVVFRRAFLDRIGLLDEHYQLTAADSEWVHRALVLGRACFVPEVVAHYRVWSGSLTHARQATDLWMDEVRHWVQRTSELMLSTHGAGFAGFDPARFQDEIIALNLLAGINGLLARDGHAEAGAFLRRQGVPPHARWRTRAQLWRRWWRTWGSRAA